MTKKHHTHYYTVTPEFEPVNRYPHVVEIANATTIGGQLVDDYILIFTISK